MSKSFLSPALLGLGLICLLPFLSGCGGNGPSAAASSAAISNGNTNGNMIVADTGTAPSGTTTMGTGTLDGPPFIQVGTPLANVSLPVGDWGGSENVDGPSYPASLSVSDDGLRLTLYCGMSAEYTGPITLDASGRFEVTGTGNVRFNSLEPVDSSKVLLSGTVVTTTSDGKSATNMVLRVTDPVSGISAENYVLFLGSSASAYEGACPGP